MQGENSILLPPKRTPWNKGKDPHIFGTRSDASAIAPGAYSMTSSARSRIDGGTVRARP